MEVGQQLLNRCRYYGNREQVWFEEIGTNHFGWRSYTVEKYTLTTCIKCRWSHSLPSASVTRSICAQLVHNRCCTAKNQIISCVLS